MSTALYYFSGTGNCLQVARRIQAAMPECSLQPMAGLMGVVRPAADAVGLVFPNYFGDLPAVVKEFAGRLEVARTRYLFAVNTAGSNAANSIHTLDRLLQGKGKGLDAGFSIPLPTNYLLGWYYRLLHGTGPSRAKMFEKAEQQIAALVPLLTSRAKTPLPRNRAAGIVPKLLNPRVLYTRLETWDRFFQATPACNQCGICRKICPRENISLADGQPVWNRHCSLCLACIHWCPQQAIQFKQSTVSRQRYHHPEIKVQDMYLR